MKKETIKFIATATAVVSATALTVNAKEIGRASCRERV